MFSETVLFPWLGRMGILYVGHICGLNIVIPDILPGPAVRSEVCDG